MSAFSYDVSLDDFDQKVLAISRRVPVLVNFWAPWCAPCRSLKPILEKLADEYQGRFLLAKLNSDKNQELAVRYGVRSIPAVKAFANGELVDEFMGALPEGRVREFIDSLVPSRAEPLRREAEAARGRGDMDATRRLLLEAISLDPKHEAARLDLVELLVEAGEFEQAHSLLDEVGDRARDGAQGHRAAGAARAIAERAGRRRCGAIRSASRDRCRRPRGASCAGQPARRAAGLRRCAGAPAAARATRPQVRR